MTDITIIMPSFNKEKYIKEALDSVFMQETTYNFHIIAADDNSTDRTVDIIKEYQKKHPGKITLLTSDKNQKLYKNVIRAYERTKTDYFCVLDPDDFWIDKYKIQKALDFLEKNKEYTIYVTDTVIQLPNGERKKYIKRKRIINSTFDDFLYRKSALGCTLGSTFRNVIFKNGLPDKMINLVSPSCEQSYRGDAFRSIIHLHEGKAHCKPEVDAVYRVTDEGLWQGSSKLSQGLLLANMNKDMWIYFDKKYPIFLLKSYFAFNSIKNIAFDELAKIEDEQKQLLQFKKLNELNKLYQENMSLLNDLIKKYVPLNLRMRKYICNELSSKLKKKGII